MPTLRHAVCLLLLLQLAAAASALTYVMMTDGELLAQADLVVLGRIDGLPIAAGGVDGTEYRVDVAETFAGEAASSITVRVPGARRLSGLDSWVPGAPAFAPGETVLLFLDRNNDGTYGVLHLALGAFHAVAHEGSFLLVRELDGAHEVALAGDRHAAVRRRSHLPRDLVAFSAWLRSGGRASRDYFVDPPPSRLEERFTLTLVSACGEAAGSGIRWTEFDTAESVTLHAHEGGEPDLPGGGFVEMQTALAVWNDDPATPIDLRYGGTTTASGGFAMDDGFNTLLQADPNDDIAGTLLPDAGGTIAATKVWTDCETTVERQGETFLKMFEADVITQDGLVNFFALRDDRSTTYAQLVTHETGHTLGLGHSCGDSKSPDCATSVKLDEAIMRAQVHSEPRGAELRADDFEAIAFLYGDTFGLPPAPSELAATALSASEIRLAWRDNSDDETSFRLEEEGEGGFFVEILSLAADTTETILSSLAEGSRHTYRLRARNDKGFSPYTNPASATTLTTGGCIADDSTLCLNGDRFRVTALFRTPDGEEGTARVEELTADTGYLWFFRDTNVEMVVKVLRACGANGNDHYWVFAGGLTNVEVELTVEDTASGAFRTYRNPQRTPFQPIQDTTAFATCP